MSAFVRLGPPTEHGSRSNLATPRLDGRCKKPLNEAGESVPVGELAVPSGAHSAAFHDDEFDDLLLEVVVFGETRLVSQRMHSSR